MAGKLDSFLEREEAEPQPVPEPEPTEASVAVEEVIEDQPEAKAAETPRQPVEEEHVLEEPEDAAGLRKALIATRTQRNDHKGRADRLEGEIAALKPQIEELQRRIATPPAPPPPAQPPVQQISAAEAFERSNPKPDPQADPFAFQRWDWARDQFVQRQMAMNISERMLRQTKGDADFDEKIAAFRDAAARDTTLQEALRVHADPVRLAYDQGEYVLRQRAEQAKRDAVLQRFGADPDAWIAQQRAEIRAQVEAEFAQRTGQPGAPQVHLPQSLGTARSAAPRETAMEVPEAFNDIVKRRRA